jgi:hypothetical protein
MILHLGFLEMLVTLKVLDLLTNKVSPSKFQTGKLTPRSGLTKRCTESTKSTPLLDLASLTSLKSQFLTSLSKPLMTVLTMDFTLLPGTAKTLKCVISQVLLQFHQVTSAS